jgi:hypothetical protein
VSAAAAVKTMAAEYDKGKCHMSQPLPEKRLRYAEDLFDARTAQPEETQKLVRELVIEIIRLRALVRKENCDEA